MTDKERALFRAFLGFDLSIPKDIYIHDKMANGMVEAPRAQAPIGTSTTTLPADILPSSKSDSGVSKVSGAPSSISGGNSSRPPIARRANSFAQKIQPPPTNYQVKIVTTGNLSASYVRANTRTKLDLKQMDGTIFTDENSVDSRTNLEYAEGLSDKKRNGSGDSGEYNNKKYPNLSLIHEEDEIDLSRRNTAAIEEDLLRIGMKKENKKPKKSCCCCCS